MLLAIDNYLREVGYTTESHEQYIYIDHGKGWSCLTIKGLILTVEQSDEFYKSRINIDLQDPNFKNRLLAVLNEAEQ